MNDRDYQAIIDEGGILVDLILEHCLEGTERSLTLSKLEECALWAEAAQAQLEVVGNK